MPELKSGCYTIKSHGSKVIRAHKLDWLILLLLVAIELLLDGMEPFHRYVGEEMMTDLKYPYKQETVPFLAAQVMSVLFPIVIFIMFYICQRDVYDLHHATKGVLFSALVTAVITDSIKAAVGRPRPSFFWRCFPDGKAVFDAITKDVVCHGDKKVIREGYRSFPSGHTSWSFAGLGFLAWYLSGKTRLFDRRGHIGKLCIVLLPLLLAGLVGISRVDDYRHHWQDVLTGGLIGMIVSSICYLLVFPFPHQPGGWAPYAYFEMSGEVEGSRYLYTRQPEV
ncbi:hypothetical protein L6164_005366 [Bauhinia variegata]|uniref:Uncharacterized protein n=1 Tax=Bauhinia variegata TaxID=167791 RepID=A0ACB9PSI2_BAUVA|nr:hypothetical protein L6164_005366 [Bauhinia variegata]